MANNPDLLNIELVLEEYLEQIRQSITDNRIEVDNKELVAAINRLPMFPSAEQIARELSKVITIPQPIDFTPTLTEVMEAIIGLKKTIRDVAGGGRNLSGGTGIVRMEEGQVVEVANDTGNPLSTSVSNFPATQAVNVTNTDVRVTNTTAQEIGQGKFNMYGTGRLSLSVAGNLRAIIRNPSTSGKTIKIHRVAGLGTSTGWATLYVNPTSGVPTAAPRPSMNAIVGGGIAGVAEVRADVDATIALSGGTDTGIVIGMAGGRRTELNLPPLILAPGVTLGINIPFTGAADATLSIYTTEV